MNKKLFPLFLVIVICFSNHTFAQKKKDELSTNTNIYLLKADWSAATNLDECTYFMQVVKQDDSCYICRYYQKYGPMARQESFKDEDLSIPNGRFCWYNSKGLLDSTGLVKNGRKDNYWEYYKDEQHTLSVKYYNGKYVNKTDYVAKLFYDEDGTQISLDEKQKTDSLYRDSLKIVQVAPKFRKGQKDWIQYIQDNLETPDRVVNVLGRGTHTAIVVFLINKYGFVDEDIYLQKSVEWYGDAEVFSLITSSPQWQPAYQNGEPVYFRMKQSLTFQVNSQ
jgi:hypothetical protein